MRLRSLLLLLLAPALLGAAPPRQTVAITNVTVVDVVAGSLERGLTVVVSDGRVAAVASDAAVPEGARLCVANGVTGVRDMHTRFPVEQVTGWVREIEEGKRVGPRFVYAGPILDGPVPIWPGSIAVKEAESGRQAVRDLKAKAVHFIKVYERLPREAYFAIADEARKQGLRFVGHVPRR